MLGVALRWTSIPCRGSRNTPSRFVLSLRGRLEKGRERVKMTAGVLAFPRAQALRALVFFPFPPLRRLPRRLLHATETGEKRRPDGLLGPDGPLGCCRRLYPPTHFKGVTGHFGYESFRLLSVRLRLESIRLRPICQFSYVLNSVLLL